MTELLIPAAELRQRIANKQIRLNDDPIDIVTYRQLDLESAEELGEWLYNFFSNQYKLFSSEEQDIIRLMLNIFDSSVWADCNSTLLKHIFKGKAILQISKKQKFVINYDSTTN